MVISTACSSMDLVLPDWRRLFAEPAGNCYGAGLVRLTYRPFLGGSHTGSVIGILRIGPRQAQSERKGGGNGGGFIFGIPSPLLITN